MQRAGRVILIGGSSHVGKTTLAGRLAERPGWSARSTDYLARHPGRPWRHPPDTLPPHVGEHYLSLDVEDLIASVLGHYRGLWPVVETIIREPRTPRSHAWSWKARHCCPTWWRGSRSPASRLSG